MKPDFATDEHQTENEPRPRRHRPKWRYIVYAFVIFLLVLVVFSVKASLNGEDSFWRHVSDTYITPNIPFSDELSALTGTPELELIGTDEDRINILLLGIGGKGHDGAYLTDTIVVASYKPSTNEVAMMSIPRDLLIPIPGHGWRKINNLYALAEYNDPGTGGDYTKQIISQIFDIQLPYFVRVDFDGFTEFIDLVGGVDVEVPRTLSDYQYPIPGREEYPEDQRYEHLYLEAGPQHLDGATALKYVRSRHALGEEGSDFARSARQQLVMQAALDKLLSVSTLLRPGKIKKILGNIEEHVDTNLNNEEMIAFAKLAKKYREESKPVITRVIDNGIEGPLQEANYGGAFVLEPKVEDFSELKFIAKNIFTPELTFTRPEPDDSGLPRVVLEQPVESKETATIEIRNGTFVHGLAKATQEKLADLGYNVTEIGNALEQDYTETVMYDFSNGQYPQTINFLSANYTDNIYTTIPLGISSSADILIILGLDVAY